MQKKQAFFISLIVLCGGLFSLGLTAFSTVLTHQFIQIGQSTPSAFAQTIRVSPHLLTRQIIWSQPDDISYGPRYDVEAQRRGRGLFRGGLLSFVRCLFCLVGLVVVSGILFFVVRQRQNKQ